MDIGLWSWVSGLQLTANSLELIVKNIRPLLTARCSPLTAHFPPLSIF